MQQLEMTNLNRKGATTAQVVCDLYQSGLKTQDIADRLNKQGIKNDKGYEFTTWSVSQVANRHGLRRRKSAKRNGGNKIKKGATSFESTPLEQLNEVMKSNLTENMKLLFIRAIAKEL